MSPETTRDDVVRLTVKFSGTTPILQFQDDERFLNVTIFRKQLASDQWEQVLDFRREGGAANPLGYSIPMPSVPDGQAFEYRVSAQIPGLRLTPPFPPDDIIEGYAYAGQLLPESFHENRGRVLLVVDSSRLASSAVQTALGRYKSDLVGDGWQVSSIEVARNDPVVSVRSRIQAVYAQDPQSLKAIVLIGHVPVPYSGFAERDGHTEHRGAWPADAFYGDMDGIVGTHWTDSSVNIVNGVFGLSTNTPGDGKFDQDEVPTGIEVPLGRIDFFDLPAFGAQLGLSDTDAIENALLVRYFDKNHAFRQAQVPVERRALIDDHWGVQAATSVPSQPYTRSYGFTMTAWASAVPVVGEANTAYEDWNSTLRNQSRLFAFGAGPGGDDQNLFVHEVARHVVRTSDYSSASGIAYKGIFSFVVGSYFGDWNYPNNVLRSTIAAPGTTLVSGWAGIPHWFLHHMAQGQTIGYSFLQTSRNPSVNPVYRHMLLTNDGLRGRHIALHGDPTLRLHVVKPARDAAVVRQFQGNYWTNHVSWNPSRDATIIGYHVYRADSADGPFVRVTSAPVSNLYFIDNAPSDYTYMVRAIKLEETPSGSYYNLSTGLVAVDLSNPGGGGEGMSGSSFFGAAGMSSMSASASSAWGGSVVVRMFDDIFGPATTTLSPAGATLAPSGGEGWSAADTVEIELSPDTSDPYRVGLYFAPGSTNHRVDVFDPATGRLVARHDVGTVGADGRTVTFTLSGRQVIRVTNLSGGPAKVAGFAVEAG